MGSVIIPSLPPKGHTRKRRGNAHNSSGFEQQIIREKKRKTAAVSPPLHFSFLLGFNSLTPHLREYARTTIPHPILASANPQPNANPLFFPPYLLECRQRSLHF